MVRGSEAEGIADLVTFLRVEKIMKKYFFYDFSYVCGLCVFLICFSACFCFYVYGASFVSIFSGFCFCSDLTSNVPF